MATVTKPIALDESLNTTEQSSRNIADVLAQEIGNLVTVVSRIAPPTTVSWNQIEQSGTKIAEITINGTKTDVYAPQGGGGFSALIIVTDALAGVTITATKGGVTKTGTSIGNNQYEISVDSSGTWTISDGTNTATVTVTAQTTYYLTLGVPDGSTVTPTDDIQTLLNCANIWDKSYTTLTELLSDSTSLQAVISSNNAIDYLVRSTSFAKANPLVPTMTSDNTPSGEVIFSQETDANYPAWKAFDNNNATGWQVSFASGDYIGYNFGSATKVKKVSITNNLDNSTVQARAIKGFKVQGYDTEWHDIGTFENNNNNLTNEFALNNDNAYSKYRVYVQTNWGNAYLYVMEVQFYSEDGFTDNSTAMSYIGLNNYASNTLLGDSTWCSAICNSTYFESVLNVKVPTMTSNNTPSGECIGPVAYSGTYWYMAFDNDESTKFTANDTDTTQWVGYIFPETVNVQCFYLYFYSSTVQTRDVSLEYSDNGTIWNSVYSSTYNLSDKTRYSAPNTEKHRYWRIKQTFSSAFRGVANELQFYGRADV